MIEGVVVKKLLAHADIEDAPGRKNSPRGFLIEVLRKDDGFLKAFGQSVFTVAHTGTIKAFHWHKKQDDLWFMATGRAKVVLYDRRRRSGTYGQTQIIFAGEGDYKLILIPRGVAHGYQVISKEPVLLFYHVTRMYDPKKPDEERMPFDDPGIGISWEK